MSNITVFIRTHSCKFNLYSIVGANKVQIILWWGGDVSGSILMPSENELERNTNIMEHRYKKCKCKL